MATTWTPPRESIFAMNDDAVAHLTDAERVRLTQTTRDALSYALRERNNGDALVYASTLEHLQAHEADRRETRWLRSRTQVSLALVEA